MNPELTQRIAAIEQNVPAAVRIVGHPDHRPIPERMELHKVPGISVAVINEGRIEWARGYGATSARDGMPVDERTLFQAASISKTLAAFAAMMLNEEGKLDLDADVNTLLKSWHLPDDEAMRGQKVTVRRIMSHTAGLNLSGMWGYEPGDAVPNTVQILNGAAPAVNEPLRVIAEPGTNFQYSGGGYTVLELVIAEVTGRPFAEHVREAVLEPCGMRDSSFAQPLPAELAERAASGHTAEGAMVPGRWTVLPALAASGLWTTATDLARFVTETQRALTGSSLLISRSAAMEMLASQPNGPAALGFWVGGDGTSARFFHTGSNIGYRAHAVGYMKGGRGAVVLTNGDDGEDLCLEVLNAIAEVYDWPEFGVEKAVADIELSVLERYVGEYEVAGLNVVVEREGGALVATAPGFGPLLLYPESETEFFFASSDGGATFTPAATGMSVIVRLGSAQLPGVRR